MKHNIIILSLLALLTYSCGEITLDEPTKPSSPSTDSTTTTDAGTDTLSVASLSEAKDSAKVLLRCYIVGYMPTMSSTKPRLSAEDAVESNIAVADVPSPDESMSFAAIQLPSNSDVRQSLNLQAHPELLNARVLLTGIKMTYYRRPGLKPAQSYKLLPSDMPPQPSTDGSGSAPADLPNFPTKSEDEEVFEGC